jgi:bacillithiol biosynthesis cysteine-adding enzyme BshC
MASTFYSSYLAGGLRGGPLMPLGLGDGPAARAARVRAAAERRAAPALVAALRALSDELPSSAKRAAHLDALARGGCAVVATGQQVGLFLGPLYTIYKAATAVVLARTLAAESGVPCIPLFWLQTEDHDYAEIASAAIPNPRTHHEVAPLELPDDGACDPRASVAARLLPASCARLVDALADALVDASFRPLPHAAEVIGLIRDAYRPGVPVGRAFARVLGALFADEGLVILDPRTPAIAALAAPIVRRALVDDARLEALLVERGQALDAAGFGAQVRLRPGSPLAFFHLVDAHGPRHRLGRRPDGTFDVLGLDAADGSSPERLDQAELLALLERDPLRFSTSALLRPIVQDSLLPTAAYVGGPAEVDYFAQLLPLYGAFELAPPLVAPRARFRLIPHEARLLLDALGLAPADFDRGADAVRAVIAARLAPSAAAAPDSALAAAPAAALASAPASAPGPAWLAEVEARLDAYAAGPEASRDPAIGRAVARTRAALRRNLAALARRHEHALLQRDGAAADRLARLTAWLRPTVHGHSAPQERVYSFPWFAARAGVRPLVDAVLAAVDPFDPHPKDIPV